MFRIRSLLGVGNSEEAERTERMNTNMAGRRADHVVRIQGSLKSSGPAFGQSPMLASTDRVFGMNKSDDKAGVY